MTKKTFILSLSPIQRVHIRHALENSVIQMKQNFHTVYTPIRGVYEKYATIFRMKDDIYVVDYSETEQVFYTTDYTKVRNNLEQNYGEWFDTFLLNRLTKKPVDRLSQ